MPINRKALLIAGVSAIQIFAPTSDVLASDLRLKSSKAHHRFVRVVADFDGTAIYLRPARPKVFRNYDGTTQVLHDGYETYPVVDIDNPKMGPQPTRYLNGQRIRP